MAKPMLPTKAWARKQADGTIHRTLHPTRAEAIRWSNTGERPVPVTITEGDGWQDPKTIPLGGKEKIHVVDRLGNQALVLPSDLAHVDGLECVTAPDHDILTIVGWQPLPAPPRRKR